MLFASGSKRYLQCFLDSTYKTLVFTQGEGAGPQMNSNRLNNQTQQHVKTQMKSLPNIKTPTKCNDEVLSNSDVKSLPNMLNTNWTQDLNKITDPNMKKTENHVRFTKRHDFWK